MRKALRNLGISLVRVRSITKDIDKSLAEALRSHSVRERHEITQCACSAVISGFFEAFLKEVAESFIGDVSALRIPFDMLPVAIQKAHYGKGGVILSAKQDGKGNYVWVTASPGDIARRLASVGAVPYDLLWEAFADTRANPGPEVIKELLRLLGVKDQSSKLEAKTGISWGIIETQLSSFLAVRNECAHTGRASNVPTPSDLRAYAIFLVRVARGIVMVLEEHFDSAEFDRSAAVPE
jgi:RiboL-PSP-HEPN